MYCAQAAEFEIGQVGQILSSTASHDDFDEEDLVLQTIQSLQAVMNQLWVPAATHNKPSTSFTLIKNIKLINVATLPSCSFASIKIILSEEF